MTTDAEVSIQQTEACGRGQELRSVRVLTVIAPGPTGGAETVVRSLTSAMRAAGHPLTLAACWCRGEQRPQLVEQARSDGVEVREVVVPHRRYLAELDELRRAVREHEPDVVHTHGYRSDLLAGLAARLEDVPVVSTVHGFTGGGVKNRLFERLQVMAYRSFDRVVAVSVPLSRTLEARGVSEEKIDVIPNAWTGEAELRTRAESRRELGLPDGEPVLGWVGRVSEEKGLDVAVRALSRLQSARLAVIGDGPETEAVKRLASGLGVAERVHWCGRVPEAAPLFPAFDLFVLSSRTEGTPMAVFESMAAGVPVVAARVGGVPEQIDEETGYPVPPEDPGAVAGAVEAALADPGEAGRRAPGARTRRAPRFGPEAGGDV